MKMEQIECSETSAYTNQMPGELPKRKHTITTLLFTYWEICVRSTLSVERNFGESSTKTTEAWAKSQRHIAGLLDVGLA